MEIAYSLWDDTAALRGMQDASLRRDGLRATHGLIGTEEWWQAIRSGTLPLHTARGVIRGLWLGQYDSGPAEFKMELEDGSLFGGMCCDHEPQRAAQRFRLGRRAEVDYVLQYLDRPVEGLPDPHALFVEIRLGEIVSWKVEPIPSYFTARERTPGSVSSGSSKPWWAFWRGT
jgi:hypothetical protein